MKRLKGVHTGKNIAEAVIPILVAIKVKDRLGFFISDNAASNNTIIRAILGQLRPNIKNPNFKRVRYLGHIINLVIKAFLFGKNTDAFEEESLIKK
jgi:hypothetical protein